MIYTQYTTYNTKAIKFKIGTRRSIVFCFHRPSINVILPVQHIAVASGLTGVYMTFPASNSAENGNHGTPTFLKAPIFWKIGQYILMFGGFFVLNAPTPLSLLPVCVLLWAWRDFSLGNTRLQMLQRIRLDEVSPSLMSSRTVSARGRPLRIPSWQQEYTKMFILAAATPQVFIFLMNSRDIC